ncbi:dTDP-glucose 4,6-dehydratase [Oleiharenicola lentus]|uniref:dTDP-glucose 4,6-dehydratase n=1 Tax=Oleiharenicola lentus TaxID=2508720 RepID=UPI003F66C94C
MKKSKLLAVTGGAGFVGSHLIDALLARGDRVVCLDLFTYAGGLAHLRQAMAAFAHCIVDRLLDVSVLRDEMKRLIIMRCDLNDTAVLATVLRECDGVLALAAETHVDYSYHAPGVFTRANVNGTQSLLDAWGMVGEGKRLLHVSTDEVYGEITEGTANEAAPLKPRNVYAATKAAGDLLAQTYARVFGLNLVIVRPCNIYGPRQQPKDLIPKTFSYLLNGQRMTIHGDGRHIREYLLVTDAVRLLIGVFDRGVAGEAYNLSSHDFQSTIDVLRSVTALLQCSFDESVVYTPDRPSPDRRYAGDNAKARALLGKDWRLVPFAEGIAAMHKDFAIRKPTPLL